MDLAEYEQINPHFTIVVGDRTIVYATPNRTTRARAETLFTKEPVTIDWLATLGPGDVLVDVGANVGMYSILAAKLHGARVFAFEPESQNYALLNRNIAQNRLDALVKAYCLALSDRAGCSELYLSSFMVGASVHSYGEMVDFRLEPMQPAHRQGCVAETLDALVGSGAVPQPTHVKIDVDGIEHKVVAGAQAVLRDRRLRSLLIEVNHNLEPHRAMVRALAADGWQYDPAQVAAAERKQGTFQGVAEYVFRR
jgi:FkbM family methyltransferase